MFLPIRAVNAVETINTVSSTDTTINSVSKEIKTYTEDEHLVGKSPEIMELYDNLKSEILNLGDITVKANKQNIVFVGAKKNIVDIVIQKNQIKVYVNLTYLEIDDYKKLVRDVSSIGKWGVGDCEFNLKNLDELDYLLFLIKQSYKKNG